MFNAKKNIYKKYKIGKKKKRVKVIYSRIVFVSHKVISSPIKIQRGCIIAHPTKHSLKASISFDHLRKFLNTSIQIVFNNVIFKLIYLKKGNKVVESKKNEGIHPWPWPGDGRGLWRSLRNFTNLYFLLLIY